MENRRIAQHLSFQGLVYRLADLAAIVAALAVALRASGVAAAEGHLSAAVAAVALYYLFGELTGAYRPWRGISGDREAACIVLTWALTVPGLVTLSFAIGYPGRFERPAALTWFALAALLLVAGRGLLRMAARLARARGYNVRRCAIVGVNELAFQLARNLDQAPEIGMRLVGLFDDRPNGRLPPVPADVGRRIGGLDQLVAAASARQLDTVYITFPMRAEGRIRSLLERLSDTTASVYIVPDFFVFELLSSRWTTISGLPAVSVFENPFYGVDGLLKRLMDVLLAATMLLLAAVPMALIAAAVKISSPGPVFFRQRRYGLDGREILVWKFRSMRVCENGAEVRQATKDDARVTPLGRVLRSTSLDELPQLFNVLEGTMSLVGPRPLAAAHNEQYRGRVRGFMLRHKVKPGITGLAQVSGCRGEIDSLKTLQDRIRCDHQYIRQWSLWLDLKILLKTVGVVLSRQHAY